MLKRKKYIRLIILLICIIIGFIVFKCKRNVIKVTKNKSEIAYEPEISVLYFPVDLSVQDIQKLANRKLKVVLIDKPQVMKNQKDSIDLKVIRKGDIQFHLKNEKLHAYIPLKVEVGIIKKMGKSSVKILKNNPIVFELDVYSESSFELREDIKIAANTVITNMTWKQEPVVKIAGIYFNVKEMVDKRLTERLPEITEAIDEVIKTKINLRKTIDRVWTKLQYNKRIGKDNDDFFIKINPQSLAVYVDKSRSDSLRLNLVAESKLYLRHIKDTADIEKVALPKKVTVLKKYDEVKNSRIYFHALLPLDELNGLINQKLSKKEYFIKGLNFAIKSVELMTGEDCIIGTINVTGSVNGTIKVKGLPVFSAKNRLITIENKEIESKLDETLINVTTDLFTSEILGILNMYSTINSGDMMDQLPELARNEIQKSKMVKKIDFRLYDLNIHSVDLKLAKDNIQLLITADADFGIGVKKEGLKLKKIE